jgi:hypothetical protein
MPILLPSLDDRTYDDLVAEARQMIPTLFSGWTDHNPSDPGIVTVELLAWLTEMVLFQVDAVVDDHVEAFLELLNGPGWSLAGAGGDLDDAVSDTVMALRERYRAVTVDDYRHLVAEQWSRRGEVARVQVVANRRPSGDALVEAAASVTVVVLPEGGREPSAGLLAELWRFLDQRRQLTVQHHVVAPTYLHTTIRARVHCHDDVVLADAVEQVGGAASPVRAWFDPHIGGDDRSGWPWGRPVYPSEIYAVLGRLPAVDRVEGVVVSTRPPEGAPPGQSIELAGHLLVDLDLSDVVVVDALGDAAPVDGTRPDA